MVSHLDLNRHDFQSGREVSREDGEKLAKDLSAVFIETSAKDNICVTDMFQVSLHSSNLIVHDVKILQNVVLQIEQLNGNMAAEKKEGCLIS